MNKILKPTIIFTTVFIIGCAQQYGPNSYKQSINDTGIIVPAPLTPQNISHFYDLPKQHYPIVQPSLQADA